MPDQKEQRAGSKQNLNAVFVRYGGLIFGPRRAGWRLLPLCSLLGVACIGRLQDLGGVAAAAKELMEFLDELEGADSPMEAFDVIGVLGDALAEGSTCEQFLRSAIA